MYAYDIAVYRFDTVFQIEIILIQILKKEKLPAIPGNFS